MIEEAREQNFQETGTPTDTACGLRKGAPRGLHVLIIMRCSVRESKIRAELPKRGKRNSGLSVGRAPGMWVDALSLEGWGPVTNQPVELDQEGEGGCPGNSLQSSWGDHKDRML